MERYVMRLGLRFRNRRQTTDHRDTGYRMPDDMQDARCRLLGTGRPGGYWFNDSRILIHDPRLTIHDCRFSILVNVLRGTLSWSSAFARFGGQVDRRQGILNSEFYILYSE